MITLLYGESLPEPYCIDMRKAKALSEVNTKGLNYTSLKGAFTSEVVELARSYPIFETKRGIVLEVATLKDLDNKEFESYLDAPSPFTEIVIICREADKRLKVYKKIKDGTLKGVTAILCDKSEVTRDKLVKTVLYELKKRGAVMQEAAMKSFLERINYDAIKDMTLLTVAGYIDTLASISKEIDPSMIEKYVPAFKEADGFLLVELLIKKDVKGLMEQVSLASPKDAIKLLCLILRSYRIAWKKKCLNTSEYGDNDLSKLDVSTLKKCIGIINETIGAIKSGYIPEDIALKVACSKLAAAM